jgi:hypothetical protein
MGHLHELIRSAYLSGIWAAGAVAAASLTVAYLSRRFVRGLPGFDGKPEMLRGAKWGGLVGVGLIVLTAGLVGLGLHLTFLPLTSVSAGQALFWAGFGWLVLHYDRESAGMFAVVTRPRRRPGQTPAEWLDQWLAGRRRQEERLRLGRRFLPPWFAFLPMLWLGAAAGGYLAFDRQFSWAMQEAKLGAEIQQALASPEVVDVIAQGRSAYKDWPYLMVVLVRPDTTPRQCERVADRVAGLLADRHEPGIWRVFVQATPGPAVAGRIYSEGICMHDPGPLRPRHPLVKQGDGR